MGPCFFFGFCCCLEITTDKTVGTTHQLGAHTTRTSGTWWATTAKSFAGFGSPVQDPIDSLWPLSRLVEAEEAIESTTPSGISHADIHKRLATRRRKKRSNNTHGSVAVKPCLRRIRSRLKRQLKAVSGHCPLPSKFDTMHPWFVLPSP